MHALVIYAGQPLCWHMYTAKNANASKVMPISLYDLSSKFHSQQHNKLLLITHLVNVSACAAFQFIVAILNSFLRSKINKYL